MAYTARVRHETRPQVRQDGRDMFQAQRDAAAADRRDESEYNLDKIAYAREYFI